MIYSYPSRGRSEAGYRVGLSSRRSRRIWYGAFFSGSSAGGSALGSGLRGRGFESRLPDSIYIPFLC